MNDLVHKEAKEGINRKRLGGAPAPGDEDNPFVSLEDRAENRVEFNHVSKIQPFFGS